MCHGRACITATPPATTHTGQPFPPFFTLDSPNLRTHTNAHVNIQVNLHANMHVDKQMKTLRQMHQHPHLIHANKMRAELGTRLQMIQEASSFDGQKYVYIQRTLSLHSTYQKQTLHRVVN